MPMPLEDKEAIRELFSEYCFRMDEFRFTALGELFTEDGEWIAPYSRARGPGEIAALMARNIPAEPRRKHFIMHSLAANQLVIIQYQDNLRAGAVQVIDKTGQDRLIWRHSLRRLLRLQQL